MDIKLLNNLPIEDLIPEKDYLGIIKKGDLIKSFLQSNKGQFSEIKMFALYGEWGSGKSTLMKYMQKKLKPDFNTFFFDTWEFEKDNNLAFSLLEFLVEESTGTDFKKEKEFLKNSKNLLKGFAKSVSISFPGLEINGEKIIEVFDSNQDESFLSIKKQFKEDFLKLETKLKNDKKREDYNIVFIDDLDRCEPENVLNLLSALKLFFTYGKKTIFFCGVDKKAVREAIRTKYNDIVKSEEYLEKIFDVSFVVPKARNFKPLVSHFFGSSEIEFGTNMVKMDRAINDFLWLVGFTNPRKVKKVLNKYSLLANLKRKHNPKEGILLIPNIYIGDDSNSNFLETITTLYILILYDFHRDKFNDIFNPQKKVVSYKKAVESRHKGISRGDLHSKQQEAVKFIERDSLNKSFLELADVNRGNQQQREAATERVIKIFSPVDVEYMDQACFKRIGYFQSQFNSHNKNIDYYFTEYLLKNINDLLFQSKSLSGFQLCDFEYLNERYL